MRVEGSLSFPLSISSLWPHIFPQKSYLFSFQTVCLKRGKKKSPSSFIRLLHWLEWWSLQSRPFVYNTLSYLYLPLLSHPILYVIGRCDTLEETLEQDSAGFKSRPAFYSPIWPYINYWLFSNLIFHPTRKKTHSVVVVKMRENED